MNRARPDGSGTSLWTAKRLGVVIAAATVATALSAVPAAAATPVDQACIGETFSMLAGPRLGIGVSSFAQDTSPPSTHPGLGDGIQLLQAGVVPDQVVLNTCNP